jgi:hypothetical protein
VELRDLNPLQLSKAVQDPAKHVGASPIHAYTSAQSMLSEGSTVAAMTGSTDG